MSTQITDSVEEEVETITTDEVLTEELVDNGLPSDKPQPRLYRVIWRWHFYAGLLVVPVVVIAAITGGLYVFVEELDPLIYPYKTVVPAEQRVPYQQLLENAKATVPEGFDAHGVTISDDPTHATQIFFHQEPDLYLYVFVNQHTGVVQGQTEYGDSVFDIILKIHRTLFAGTPGSLIVELSTSWAIILVITGIYLWWPRGRKKVEGVWVPRVKGKSYMIWRDWHTVPGFYFSLLAFLVMFTGLFFTELFGTGYSYTAYLTKAYPPSYINPPNSVFKEGVTPLTVDDVVAVALREQSEKELFVDLPHTGENSYSVYCGVTDNLSTYSNLFIDQYSGEVIDRLTLEDLSAMAITQLLAYPIHVGSIYGLPTKILAVLVCLMIVAMSVTGTVIWWKRRPRGKTGFPQKPQAFKPAKWLIVLICLLGLLMPAAGISILMILLGDYLWQKRKGRMQEAA